MSIGSYELRVYIITHAWLRNPHGPDEAHEYTIVTYDLWSHQGVEVYDFEMDNEEPAPTPEEFCAMAWPPRIFNAIDDGALVAVLVGQTGKAWFHAQRVGNEMKLVEVS